MTPHDCKQYDMVSRRVRDMRQGGQADDQIYAELMRDGWPTDAVVQALAEGVPMSRPGGVIHD